MSRRRRRPPVSNIKPHPLPPKEATPDIRKIVRDEVADVVSKALSLPRGATATTITPENLQQIQMQMMNGQTSLRQGSAAMARDPYSNVTFGPNFPLIPAPLDPPMASGRPAPRRNEFRPSINLQVTEDRKVPWAVLRDVADNVPVVRSCIETCKSAITGLEWSFGVDTKKARALAKKSGTSSHAVVQDLQDKYADKIEQLHTWWQTPDRINNWAFTEWVNAVLEDEIVYDAVALYPHLTMRGDLHSLELIEASTIKPILDHRGATPQAPYAAFQQILWGFPRGEWDQHSTPTDELASSFVSSVYGKPAGPSARTDSLIYKVRNRRSRGPYGFSSVEQALPAVDLWLKRWHWLSAEFDDGVIPSMVVEVDAAMTAEQMREWQSILNDALSGNIGERHRAQFLPQGFKVSYPEGFEAKFSSDLDLHLIRLICASLDVLPTSLGFTPSHGMGAMGARGQMQGEQDAQLQRGTKPRAQFLIDLMNEVSMAYLDMPPEITAIFHGLDIEDQQKDATLRQGKLGSAQITLNECRDELNMPRYQDPKANEPFVLTATGLSFLDSTVEPTGMPGNLPSAPQGLPAGQQPPKALPPGQSKPDPDDEDDSDDEGEGTPAQKKAEQKAFMGYARRRQGAWRDFLFKAHSPDVATAANFLAADGHLDAVKALFAHDDDAA